MKIGTPNINTFFIEKDFGDEGGVDAGGSGLWSDAGDSFAMTFQWLFSLVNVKPHASERHRNQKKTGIEQREISDPGLGGYSLFRAGGQYQTGGGIGGEKPGVLSGGLSLIEVHRRRYSMTFPITSSMASFTMNFLPVVVEIIVSGVGSINSIKSALITIGSP